MDSAIKGQKAPGLTAADVLDVVRETPNVRTIAFDVPGWPGHRAGQHVDVRLTAEDGYQAQRSYSIASTPSATRVELTVERLDDTTWVAERWEL